MNLFGVELPASESINLELLVLATIVIVGLYVIRFAAIKRAEIQLRRDELRLAQEQAEVSEARESAQREMTSRFFAQAAEQSKLLSDAISTIGHNSTVMRESFGDLHEAVRDGFRETIRQNQETAQGLRETRQHYDDAIADMKRGMVDIKDAMHRQHEALQVAISSRNTGDTSLLLRVNQQVTAIDATLEKMSQSLDILISKMENREDGYGADSDR